MPDHSSALLVPDIERQLIAGLFLHGSKFYDVEPIVRPEDFEMTACRACYDAMEKVDYFRQQGPSDSTSLLSWLVSRWPIMSAGDWETWLIETVGFATSSAHVLHNARTVAKAALGRRLIARLGSLRADLDTASPVDHADQEKLIDDALAEVSKLVEDARRGGLFVQLSDDAMAEVDETEKNGDQVSGAFRYGLRDLDFVTRGMHRGEFVVVGGRTSHGKSTFALQVAINAAQQGGKVLVYSLEMAPREVSRRVLCNQSGLELFNLRRELNVGELDGLRMCAEQMRSWPLTLSQSQKADLRAIVSEARAFKAKGGLDLLVLDYLQLVEGPEHLRNNRTAEVGAISRALKTLAVELDCIVLSPSQLNDEGKVRESRSIEHDSNVFLEVSYDEDEPGVMSCRVAKNRHGERGSNVRLQWHKPTYRVRDLAGWKEEAVIGNDWGSV